MKWLQDNPLGVVLAGISGGFVLLAAVLAIIWTFPVAVETTGAGTRESAGTAVALSAHQAGSLNEFQVINEKPLFNESRLPVIAQLDADETLEDTTIAIKDAPDVRLTGVIITPNARIASLMPAGGKQESVMAHEGQPLTGEFVGWQVTSVKPRNVVLESRDGQTMELDMQVYDSTIKAPPKPVPVPKTASKTGGEADGRDGEPLSRAEQIRQRIAERREELRREQEAQQARAGQPQSGQSQSQRQADSNKQASKPPTYQSAIRALMNNNRKDKASSGNKDG